MMGPSFKERDKMPINSIAVLLAVFLFMAPAEAFFRHLCFNPLGFGRVDPMMSPGSASTHLHHLHGSGNLGIGSVDADYLLESNCTSCSITLDKSAYWAPAMYFHHENGTFELMTTSGSITIYYKTEKRVNFLNQNYTAFPKGFRMIAGNNTSRDWIGPWPVPQQSIWGPADLSQDALAQKALGFNCLNYNRGWEEATFAYPWLRNKTYIDENCSQGVRAEILFPSCWDGVNLDSHDHKSHVAYPTLLQDGACPLTHPVFLPILFFETIWNTQSFVDVPGQFVMSNGDPTGYGYHADFIAAWEDGVLEQVMADPNCTDQDIFNRHVDGIQEHCPVFYGHIQSQEEAAQCKLKMPQAIAKDQLIGAVDFLPGNIKIVGLQHDPVTPPDNAPPVVASPAASNSTTVVASLSSSVVIVSNSSTPAPTSNNVPPKPTVRPTAFSTGMAAPVVYVSSYTSDGVYHEVDVVEQIVTVTNTVTPTNTATATVKAAPRHHIHSRLHRDIM